MEELINRFLLRHSNFKSLDREIVKAFLMDAQLEICKSKWGELYEKGLFALTAHLLTLSQQSEKSKGAAQLPVASETAGQLSVSYVAPATQSTQDNLYAVTSYGQEYIRLKGLLKIGIMVV